MKLVFFVFEWVIRVRVGACVFFGIYFFLERFRVVIFRISSMLGVVGEERVDFGFVFFSLVYLSL